MRSLFTRSVYDVGGRTVVVYPDTQIVESIFA